METGESLLEFPCSFDIKAMGRPEDGFRELVTSLIAEHVEDMSGAKVSEKPSSAGNYIAVTVRFEAQSREQLDAIYRALSDEPRVLVAL